MTTKQQKEIFGKIENFYSRLSNIIDTSEWYNNSLEKAFELEYQNYKPVTKNAKVKAKASCVNFIFEGLNKIHTAKDFLGIRQGVFMCYAFSEKYKDEILKEFSQEEIDFMKNIWIKI